MPLAYGDNIHITQLWKKQKYKIDSLFQWYNCVSSIFKDWLLNEITFFNIDFKTVLKQIEKHKKRVFFHPALMPV